MVNVIIWILLATLINSLVGLIGVVTFWCKEKTLQKMLFILVAFSAGTLLGGAFLHIAAEAIEMMAGETLESVEIIRTMGEALPRLAERGLCALEMFPLMRMLADVVVREQPVDMPLDAFSHRAELSNVASQ